MKKILPIIFSVICLGVLISYISYSKTNRVELSDLTLISIEGLTSDEGGGINYGPAKVVDCVGKLHKKICMCEPGYPECTETECF